MNVDKTHLRAHFRAIRARISPLTKKNAAKEAATIFANSAFFAKAKNIACYLAVNSEFATDELLKVIWQAKKAVFLPVLAPAKHQFLDFAHYVFGDKLQPNRYGILEPSDKTLTLKPEQLDIIILPLIAFDKKGNRLGTGGGYYDRTLAHVDHKTELIGLGFANQETAAIPAEKWDIPLDAVITEKKIIVF